MKQKDYKNRYEKLDDRPAALPVGFERPPTLQEQIQRFVRSALVQRELDARGVETFDEAEDFDVDDESFDPSTPYELQFEPSLGKEVTRGEKEFFDRQRAEFDQQLAAAKKAPKKAKRVFEEEEPTKKAKKKPELSDQSSDD